MYFGKYVQNFMRLVQGKVKKTIFLTQSYKIFKIKK